MSEYDSNFACTLIGAARYVADNGVHSQEAARTVLYLSKLACEILLKSLLEKAGKPVPAIKKHRHSLSALRSDIAFCEIRKRITASPRLYWVRASHLFAQVVDKRYADATVGNMLEAENHGASKYPDRLRYGDSFRDYHPVQWLRTAEVILEWANRYGGSIRVRQK